MKDCQGDANSTSNPEASNPGQAPPKERPSSEKINGEEKIRILSGQNTREASRSHAKLQAQSLGSCWKCAGKEEGVLHPFLRNGGLDRIMAATGSMTCLFDHEQMMLKFTVGKTDKIDFSLNISQYDLL